MKFTESEVKDAVPAFPLVLMRDICFAVPTASVAALPGCCAAAVPRPVVQHCSGAVLMCPAGSAGSAGLACCRVWQAQAG